MKIEIGQEPKPILQNIETAQWAYVQVHDILGYRGHAIVYGTLLENEIYIPAVSGPVTVPQRPTAFPWLSDPIPGEIEALVKELDGHPLWVVENPKPAYDRAYDRVMGRPMRQVYTRGVPVLNMRMVPGFGKGGSDRDAMISRATRMVDLYLWAKGTNTTKGGPWDEMREAQRRARTRAQMDEAHAKDNGLLIPKGGQWFFPS